MISSEQSYSGVDLVVPIVLRSYNGDTPLAQGFPMETDNFHRPINGVIFLNTKFIPKDAQDERSWEKTFFQILIHEFCHILGISEPFFNNYHPYETRQSHSQITCSFRRFGKDYTFLVTPFAHKFAKKRYGVETFQGDGKTCPAGIELESGGGEGSAMSHLAGRVHYSELMTAQAISGTNGPFERLTDATIAILQDTGNYKCNYYMAQPLVWGNPESNKEAKFFDDFATGIPSEKFPSHYLHRTENDTMRATSFDFKHYGGFAGFFLDSNVRCPNDNVMYKKYCEARYNYYNPDKKEFVQPLDMFDFINVTYPKNACDSGFAILPGAIYEPGVEEKCSFYICNKFESFDIYLDNYSVKDDKYDFKKITCDKNTIGKTYMHKMKGYDEKTKKNYEAIKYSTCPDPEIFCRTVKLHETTLIADPFDENTTQLVEPDPYDPEPEPTDEPDDPDDPDDPDPTEEPENPDDPFEDDTSSSSISTYISPTEISSSTTTHLDPSISTSTTTTHTDPSISTSPTTTHTDPSISTSTTTTHTESSISTSSSTTKHSESEIISPSSEKVPTFSSTITENTPNTGSSHYVDPSSSSNSSDASNEGKDDDSHKNDPNKKGLSKMQLILILGISGGLVIFIIIIVSVILIQKRSRRKDGYSTEDVLRQDFLI
ncbi:GP63-like [Trichomonas vaginalis G3]|uniref:GP63-like n=1 Tax=Trichomonas vaginalis (strain ATCC PRA-98 / G3) TaxID=412133 RepID=A2ER94_TRIV3|nr:regulation of choline O-acetyltransferase protein [Trichomonas vaginalis G3]EAY04847.1 GP63-like [Trichomonas vaginalis G3]KAI5535369.1 regulation of choline O-acetyltransferase protein [Trichomonas vaginalis G3]|eukprot:XP_001317070.1 GP63-like [Trichomonas vaginalis G3]